MNCCPTPERMRKLVPPNGAWRAVRQTKAILHQPLVEEVSQALDRENEVLIRLFGGTDFQEAVAAMFEKRDPVFKK